MMKKQTSKFLALVLVLGMVLSQGALAASYKINVKIADDADSSKYVEGTTNVVGADGLFVPTMAAKVNAMKSEIETTFAGTGLRSEFETALSGAENDTSAWGTYVDSKVTDATLKAALSNVSNTIADTGLDFDKEYTVDDGRYTVTLKIVTRSNGGTTTTTGAAPVASASVKINPAANGAVKADKVTANAGEKVTFTVDPAAGYQLKNFSAVDADGDPIIVTDEGNGKYSFVMPEGGVTISEEFKASPAAPTATGVATKLNTNPDFAYMQGNEKGEFMPNAPITRAELAQIFYNLLLDKTADTSAVAFADVAEDAWYTEAVTTMAALGFMNGATATEFAPAESMTRAEFIDVCVRFALAVEGKAQFADVADGYWANNAIATAVAYGWITGDEAGNFNPENSLTRSEAAAIVNRMLGRFNESVIVTGKVSTRFADVSNNHWAVAEIAEATH